jgi:hypothetical protein
MTNNLLHFIKKRNHQLTFFRQTMRYFNVFFVLDIKTQKFVRMSHCFNVFVNKEEDTSINFPMGLIKSGNSYMVSLGESDYKTVLIEIPEEKVNQLFNWSNPEDYAFLTFDSAGKSICYNDSMTGGHLSYYEKYMKYKAKYIALKQ